MLVCDVCNVQRATEYVSYLSMYNAWTTWLVQQSTSSQSHRVSDCFRCCCCWDCAAYCVMSACRQTTPTVDQCYFC